MPKSEGKSVVVNSWNSDDELNVLIDLKRRNQIVTGIVRTIIDAGNRNVVDNESGDTRPVRAEVAVIALMNGVTGYCPLDKFAVREFKSLRQFVGKKVDVCIDQIRTDLNQVFLDGKKAQQMKTEELWERLAALETSGTLQDVVFKGTITGLHSSNRSVFVNIEGQDALIPIGEWAYNTRDIYNAQEGEEIKVKIASVDFETKRIIVSRKATLPDPFVFLEALKYGDAVAGRVSNVDPQDGIKVMLESGIVVRASKLKELESPVVDEMVNCTILRPIKKLENGRVEGRVVITNYPQGKRKMRDFGSFLFQ